MDTIKIAVELTAPKELITAITSFASALGAIGTITGKGTLPEVKEDKPTEKPSEKVEKAEKASKSQNKEVTTEKTIEESTNEESGAEEIVTYTAVEVRTKLRSLVDSEKAAEMKQIIASFGVNKLSEIPPEKYPEVMKLAEKAEKGEALA